MQAESDLFTVVTSTKSLANLDQTWADKQASKEADADGGSRNQQDQDVHEPSAGTLSHWRAAAAGCPAGPASEATAHLQDRRKTQFQV